MAYTPQTPDELQFMAAFNKNRAAIEAYKQQHGGDLEGAFRAVTGVPWPEGRSVKISHGQPEMTKDRSFGSVLKKWVAPIAGGALAALTAGGALPALGGIFGGGGAAGGGVAGGGLGTGALAAGATVPGAGAAAIPAALKGGGSIISKILGSNAIGDIASGAGDYASQAATNRLQEAETAKTGPATDAAAMRNLLHASYIAGGGAKPPVGNPLAGLPTFAGQKLPDYGFGPQPSTPGAQQFSQQMQDELLKRIKAGQPLTLSGIAPSGKVEKAAGIASAALPIAKSVFSLFG